jgi:hypothetical protein
LQAPRAVGALLPIPDVSTEYPHPTEQVYEGSRINLSNTSGRMCFNIFVKTGNIYASYFCSHRYTPTKLLVSSVKKNDNRCL